MLVADGGLGRIGWATAKETARTHQPHPQALETTAGLALRSPPPTSALQGSFLTASGRRFAFPRLSGRPIPREILP